MFCKILFLCQTVIYSPQKYPDEGPLGPNFIFNNTFYTIALAGYYWDVPDNVWLMGQDTGIFVIF